MKNLIIYFIKKHISKIDNSQKVIGFSGKTVRVPHQIVLKLAIEDKKKLKSTINSSTNKNYK